MFPTKYSDTIEFLYGLNHVHLCIKKKQIL